MTDEQIPEWIGKEADHLQPILLELRRLRRYSIWGLQSGRRGVEEIAKLGRSVSKNKASLSQYEPVRKLFEDSLELSERDRLACNIYFDPAGTYNNQGAGWRREQTGIEHFEQLYSVFRDPINGQERPFLVRIATAIYRLQARPHPKPDASQDTLGPSLVNLLNAQISSGCSSPYWYGDFDMPELREVYVPVALRKLNPKEEDYVSLQDAIDDHRHLLITGGPGAGKSTLAIQFVTELSQKLLRSPEGNLIPIYIPARLLIHSGTLQGSLISALNRYLSLNLTVTLEESIFSDGLLASKRWIVFVDGIDEILNAIDRARLIEQLGFHLKANNAENARFRFVVLGRQIEDKHFASSKDTGIVQYRVEPFNDRQLEEFVESWICATTAGNSQRTVAAAAEARELLGMVIYSGAQTTIGVPLLATLSLIAYRKGSWLFPVTVVGLYESFITTLLFGRQESVKTLKQVRQRFEEIAGDAGLKIADWIYQKRRDICANVAFRMLNGDDRPLLVIADEWIHGEIGNPEGIREWMRYLESILIDTGLLIRQGGDLSFVHREIVMYLAAPIAGWPGDGDVYEYSSWLYGDTLDEDGSWRFFSHGSYNRFRIIAAAYEDGCDTLISAIAEDGVLSTPRERIEIIEELIEWGLPLSYWGAETYVDLFLKENRGERQAAQEYGDKFRVLVDVADVDYIRLLSILASQYPDLAERVLAEEYAKYLGPPAPGAVGLVSLWKLGNKKFVEEHLYRRLALKPNLDWYITVIMFYVELEERDLAREVVRRAKDRNGGQVSKEVLTNIFGDVTWLRSAIDQLP